MTSPARVAVLVVLVVAAACVTADPSGNTAGPSSAPGSTPSTPPQSTEDGLPLTSLGSADVGKPLAAGSYLIDGPFGVPTEITVPAGWAIRGIDQGDLTLGSGDAWIVIDILENVYADPCHSRGGPMAPPVVSTVDAVVGALGVMAGFRASSIEPLTIGTHRGSAFDLDNSINTRSEGCYGIDLLPMWTYRGGTDTWTVGGMRERMWVVDVAGTIVVVDRGGPGVDAIVESLRFGSPESWTPPPPTDAPAGPRLSYVALGDSLLFAAEEDCDGCTSAAVLFGRRMANDLGRPVDVHNLTMHNSLTTAGLRGYFERGVQLGRNPEDLFDAVAGADLISLTIGFNDPTSSATNAIPGMTQAYRNDLNAILRRITDLRAGKPTAIRVTTFYNNGGSEWRKVVEAMNDVACDVAARHEAICVDLYRAINGPEGTASVTEYLGKDLTHPSQKGMDVIAAALASAGYAPLE